jgi:hypothetical protein
MLQRPAGDAILGQIQGLSDYTLSLANRRETVTDSDIPETFRVSLRKGVTRGGAAHAVVGEAGEAIARPAGEWLGRKLGEGLLELHRRIRR